jgi:ketosteroid isomerase-like protein
MSAEENLAMIRRGYDAFNRRDPAATRGDMHPEFRLDFSNSVGLDGEVYCGEDGMTKLFELYWESFETIRIEPEEFIEAGDHVIAVVCARGRGRGSGVDVEARGPHVWSFRDGKVIGFTLYQELSEALEAVGLSE